MRFYFTFGSDERFPYQNTYIIIDAPNRTKAHKAFREKFPDRDDVEMAEALWKACNAARKFAAEDVDNQPDVNGLHNKYVLGLNYVATKWNVPVECITCWF